MIESRVRLLMKEKGLSIRELAEKTGLAIETISRIRDARIGKCYLTSLIPVAKVLNVTVNDLFSLSTINYNVKENKKI